CSTASTTDLHPLSLHDALPISDSPAVLVTTDEALAAAVEREIERLLPELERSEILGKALADHGTVAVAPDMETAVGFANDYAAEDRKSTRLNSSHVKISYAVFC